MSRLKLSRNILCNRSQLHLLVLAHHRHLYHAPTIGSLLVHPKKEKEISVFLCDCDLLKTWGRAKHLSYSLQLEKAGKPDGDAGCAVAPVPRMKDIPKGEPGDSFCELLAPSSSCSGLASSSTCWDQSPRLCRSTGGSAAYANQYVSGQPTPCPVTTNTAW